MPDFKLRDFTEVIDRWVPRVEISSLDAARFAREEAGRLAGLMTDGVWVIPSVDEFSIEISKRREG